MLRGSRALSGDKHVKLQYSCLKRGGLTQPQSERNIEGNYHYMANKKQSYSAMLKQNDNDNHC